MTGPTCNDCGSDLVTGKLSEDPKDAPEQQACPKCQPDHPLSVAVQQWFAERPDDTP